MAEKIYYDLSTDIAFRADGSQLANDNKPELLYKLTKELQVQFLNSSTLTDVHTGLAATANSATAAVDNDAVHYDDGAVSTPAIVGGVAIATIKVSGLSLTPRICGQIKLTNSDAETETINYRGYSLANGIYTFTLADVNYTVGDQTPTYSYDVADAVRVLQLPIVKDSAVDCTDKATGLFAVTLDCYNAIYQDLIEGNTEISNCKFEIQILDSDGDLIMAKKFGIKCLYLLDDDGGVPPVPSFAGADLEFGAGFSIITVDRTTGERRRWFIDDGIFGSESA